VPGDQLIDVLEGGVAARHHADNLRLGEQLGEGPQVAGQHLAHVLDLQRAQLDDQRARELLAAPQIRAHLRVRARLRAERHGVVHEVEDGAVARGQHVATRPAVEVVDEVVEQEHRRDLAEQDGVPGRSLGADSEMTLPDADPLGRVDGDAVDLRLAQVRNPPGQLAVDLAALADHLGVEARHVLRAAALDARR
jgi:hypothetical protein